MAEKITSTAAVKEIMKSKDITNADLSRMVHVTPQSMYERLAKDNMKVSTLCEMLAVLGYKVVVVPGSKKVVAGEYELK